MSQRYSGSWLDDINANAGKINSFSLFSSFGFRRAMHYRPLWANRPGQFSFCCTNNNQCLKFEWRWLFPYISTRGQCAIANMDSTRGPWFKQKAWETRFETACWTWVNAEDFVYQWEVDSPAVETWWKNNFTVWCLIQSPLTVSHPLQSSTPLSWLVHFRCSK